MLCVGMYSMCKCVYKYVGEYIYSSVGSELEGAFRVKICTVIAILGISEECMYSYSGCSAIIADNKNGAEFKNLLTRIRSLFVVHHFTKEFAALSSILH